MRGAARYGLTPPSTPDRPAPATEPTTAIALGRIAGARSGDKGGNANVGLWARHDEAYDWLASYLTEDRLRQLLAAEAEGLTLRRYELANLRAINLVVEGLLGRGVAASTRIDPQAKGLGEYLRAKVVEVPTRLLRPADLSRAGAPPPPPPPPASSAPAPPSAPPPPPSAPPPGAPPPPPST